MLLCVFRINILAGAENDYILLTRGDKQVAFVVEVAQVTGSQPSILENCSSSIGTFVVARRHDGSANGDFTSGLAGAIFSSSMTRGHGVR